MMRRALLVASTRASAREPAPPFVMQLVLGSSMQDRIEPERSTTSEASIGIGSSRETWRVLPMAESATAVSFVPTSSGGTSRPGSSTVVSNTVLSVQMRPGLREMS